jgi:hypothetical protein
MRDEACWIAANIAKLPILISPNECVFSALLVVPFGALLLVVMTRG